MNVPLSVTFLGTGTSHGIPMIGCDCSVCQSDDPRDTRFRTCCALDFEDPHSQQRTIIIDMPPEFRLAAIANHVKRVDAILLTHAHADHIMGMDDIRRFNDMQRMQVPCFGDDRTIQIVRGCFAHADRPYNKDGWPSLGFGVMDQPTDICGLLVIPVPLLHGCTSVLGYRIGDFAYCTDVSKIPESSKLLLTDLDVLVLDGLRRTPHPTHFNLEAALGAIDELKPRQAYLTHIAHELGHAATSAQLPPNVALAYDGLKIALPPQA